MGGSPLLDTDIKDDFAFVTAGRLQVRPNHARNRFQAILHVRLGARQRIALAESQGFPDPRFRHFVETVNLNSPNMRRLSGPGSSSECEEYKQESQSYWTCGIG